MSLSAWPTVDDVTAKAASVGASVPTGFDVESVILEVVEMIENGTGFRPFLAEAVDSSRVYDPPDNGNLRFKGGYASITSITLNATLLGLGTDYDLEPANADADGRPFRRIRFRWLGRHHFGSQGYQDTSFGVPYLDSVVQPRSLTIVGKRGFSAVIPQSIWNAVRDQAASIVVTAFLGAGGVIEKIKQGPVEIDYATANKGEDIVTRLQEPMNHVLRSTAYSKGRF